MKTRIGIGSLLLAALPLVLAGCAVDGIDPPVDETVAANESAAIVNCSNIAPTQIVFSTERDSTLNTPPHMLRKGSNIYLPTDNLYVFLHVDNCAVVTKVTVGDLDVPVYEPHPIESPTNFYETTSVPDGASSQWLKVRLKMSNGHEGATGAWRIKLAPVVNLSATINVDFSVSDVYSVGGKPALWRAETDLKNALIANLYKRFGDLGYDTQTSQGPQMQHPDYAGTNLQIDPSGISLNTGMELHLSNDCNPKGNISAKFALKLDGGNIGIQWISGPSKDIDWDFGDFSCIDDSGFWAVLLEPLVNIFYDTGVVGQLKKSIEEQVTSQIQCPQGLPCNLFIEALANRDDALKAVLKPSIIANSEQPLTVTVKVPYRTVHQSGSTGGMAIPVGDHVFVMPNGVAQACKFASTDPANCPKTPVGPTGLFNSNIAFEDDTSGHIAGYPIPRADFCVGGACGVNFERLHAREALFGLARTASLMPLPNRKVGAVVFRRQGTSGSQLMGNGEGCITASQVGRDHLFFGVNDQRLNSQEQGVGDRYVTVVWTPFPETCF